ncbi:MAG: hypothetical protein AAGD06_11665 [Acidobacteriota bacterium]
MLPPKKRPSAFVVLLFAVLLLAACSSKTPEEKVAEVRGQYTVELNAWFPKVVDEPAPADAPLDGEAVDGEGEDAATDEPAADEPAADAAADGETDGEGGEGEGDTADIAEPAGPSTIFFDLVVYFNGDDSLPGITLDVSQADPFEKEKATWRQWVELPSMINGQTEQVTFELEVDDFQDGDAFSVVLETALSAEERSEYREFATAAQ